MGQRLRKLALIGLGAALSAFAIIPALHLIGHEDDHVHIGGTIVHLEDHDHGHSHEDEDAPDPKPLDHGAGSLAHFAAPTLEASPPIVPVPLLLTHELARPSEPVRSHRMLATHRARAPPSR